MYWILLLIPSRQLEVCMPLAAMFLDENNWGEPKQTPHKLLIQENRYTFVCMCVYMYVCPNTSSTFSSHTCVHACAQIHAVKIVSVDHVLTLNVAHQTTEACFEAQAEE